MVEEFSKALLSLTPYRKQLHESIALLPVRILWIVAHDMAVIAVSIAAKSWTGRYPDLP